MRNIVYLLLFALVFLIVKAMFLDDYLAQRKAQEKNASAETSQSAVEEVPPEPAAPAPKEQNQMQKNLSGLGDQNDTPDMRMMPDYKQAPMEKLGDKIADKIGDKL